MTSVSRLSPGAPANSPYAAELQRGAASKRFSPALETQYLQAQLAHGRTTIRITCLLAAALAVLRGADQALTVSWNSVLAIDFAWVIGSSIVLAAIAWSAAFERQYPIWACALVPARNVIVASHIALAAAHGQPEMLTILPAALIGPFFLLGLRFRAAVFSGALTVASFIVSAGIFGLPLHSTLRCSIFLVVGVTACAFVLRQMEQRSRAAFLESGLMEELAQHDALTGTKNRRVFDDYLARLWQQASEDGRTLALILIDVDHFKAYNDRYGHQAGDQALRRVAQTVQKFVRRPLDVLARYGGEEFAAILYDFDPDQARDLAERMRRAVADLNLEHRGSRTAPTVTISVGVAALEPSFERHARGALQLADQALYEAKTRGRNRVEFMDTTQHRMLVTGVFASGSSLAGGR